MVKIKSKILLIFLTMIELNYNVILFSNNNKPNIAIVSLYSQNYKAVGQYSDWNKIKYANKHGYAIHLYDEVLDNNFHPAWSKILAVQKHINDYDWILWSDADSLIMDFNVKLEDIIDNKFDFIICQDCQYDDNNKRLNTGVFLIKNSEWAKSFLNRLNPNNWLNHISNFPFWEQSALWYIIEQEKNIEVLDKIKILSPKVMNYMPYCMGFKDENYFILHFASCSFQEKLKSMEKYYQIANEKN